MEYRLAVDSDAVRFLFSLNRSVSKQLLSWLERLRDVPHEKGRSVVRDLSGREIQVGEFAGYLIYYWPDHAIKTVVIVRIEFFE